MSIPGAGALSRDIREKEFANMQAMDKRYNPTLRERLIQQKADLTQKLADVDSAIGALDANPNFEEVLNVINRVY